MGVEAGHRRGSVVDSTRVKANNRKLRTKDSLELLSTANCKVCARATGTAWITLLVLPYLECAPHLAYASQSIVTQGHIISAIHLMRINITNHIYLPGLINTGPPHSSLLSSTFAGTLTIATAAFNPLSGFSQSSGTSSLAHS